MRPAAPARQRILRPGHGPAPGRCRSGSRGAARRMRARAVARRLALAARPQSAVALSLALAWAGPAGLRAGDLAASAARGRIGAGAGLARPRADLGGRP